MATDEYFSAGSDDFRGYVWKLPDAAEITQRREKVCADNWAVHDLPYDMGKFSRHYRVLVVIYVRMYTRLLRRTRGAPIRASGAFNASFPVERYVGSSFIRTWSSTHDLAGHKSIVNTTLIHPSFLHILTSGVERHIILHGTAESSPCASNMSRTDTQTRSLPDGTPEDHERFIRALDGSHPTLNEDGEESGDEFDTIPLFDQ